MEEVGQEELERYYIHDFPVRAWYKGYLAAVEQMRINIAEYHRRYDGIPISSIGENIDAAGHTITKHEPSARNP